MSEQVPVSIRFTPVLVSKGDGLEPVRKVVTSKAAEPPKRCDVCGGPCDLSAHAGKVKAAKMAEIERELEVQKQAGGGSGLETPEGRRNARLHAAAEEVQRLANAAQDRRHGSSFGYLTPQQALAQALALVSPQTRADYAEWRRMADASDKGGGAEPLASVARKSTTRTMSTGDETIDRLTRQLQKELGVSERDARVQAARLVLKQRTDVLDHVGEVRKSQPPGLAKLAARLRGHRVAKGLTQAEVSVLTGMSLRAVNGWENAEHLPQPQVLSRLAHALGLSKAEADELSDLWQKARA